MSKAGETPKQASESIEIQRKRRARLSRKMYRNANALLDCNENDEAAKLVALLEKQYEFDVKNPCPEATEVITGLPKTGEPVTLSIHQGGSIESKRKHILGRLAEARGVSGNGRGPAGGNGSDAGVAAG